MAKGEVEISGEGRTEASGKAGREGEACAVEGAEVEVEAAGLDDVLCERDKVRVGVLNFAAELKGRRGTTAHLLLLFDCSTLDPHLLLVRKERPHQAQPSFRDTADVLQRLKRRKRCLDLSSHRILVACRIFEVLVEGEDNGEKGDREVVERRPET